MMAIFCIPLQQPFQTPLNIMLYLETVRSGQSESLRRFTGMPYDQPAPETVTCSFTDCSFVCTTLEGMLAHQEQCKHPGWSKAFQPKAEDPPQWKCHSCLKCFKNWANLYQHLATHSKPFKCSECVKTRVCLLLTFT